MVASFYERNKTDMKKKKQKKQKRRYGKLLVLGGVLMAAGILVLFQHFVYTIYAQSYEFLEDDNYPLNIVVDLLQTDSGKYAIINLDNSGVHNDLLIVDSETKKIENRISINELAESDDIYVLGCKAHDNKIYVAYLYTDFLNTKKPCDYEILCIEGSDYNATKVVTFSDGYQDGTFARRILYSGDDGMYFIYSGDLSDVYKYSFDDGKLEKSFWDKAMSENGHEVEKGMFCIKESDSLLLYSKDEKIWCLEADDYTRRSDGTVSGTKIRGGCYVGDELYAYGGIGESLIYHYVDGKAELICDINQIASPHTMMGLNINDSSPRNYMVNVKDGMAVVKNNQIYILNQDGKLLDYIDQVKVSFRDEIIDCLRRLVLPIGCILIFLGAILYFGSLMQWKKTIIMKNMLVIPILAIFLGALIHFIISMTVTFDDDKFKDVSGIFASYLSNSIDRPLLDSFDDKEYEEKPEYIEFTEKINKIHEESAYDARLFVLQKFEGNYWKCLYDSSGTKMGYNQSFFSLNLYDEKNNNTEYYELLENLDTPGRYYEYTRLLKDDKGEIYGAIVIQDVNLDDNCTIVKIYLIIIIGLLMIVLTTVIILVSRYVIRNLRKVSDAVKGIASGNYSERIEDNTKDELGEISISVNNMAEKIEKAQSSIINGMATMVESRDPNTGGHIKRTSDVVRTFANTLLEHAEELNIDARYIYNVAKAAPMHDLGKIAVDDAILRKPGKFTDEEYAVMKNHSKEGARIVDEILKDVDDIEFRQIAENVAHYHHEKWNGTGYPEHISGEDIPLEARIMALADVFDALVSKRCYKEAFDFDRAFGIIESDLGTHFDPKLGALFISARANFEAMYRTSVAEGAQTK